MKGNFKSGKCANTVSKRFVLGVPLSILLWCFMSCNQIGDHNKKTKDVAKEELYYCPMHPDIQQDHPGICPKPECNGMELIIKEPAGILNMALQLTNSVVLSDVKTIHPEERVIETTIEAQGYVDYDERTRHNIPAVIDGRIEKLYIKYNYQPVRRGQRVFDIYSPELVTAQQNLVFLLQTDKDATELVNAAKQKLRILEMSDAEIMRLIASRKVLYSVPVYSKWDGHIQEERGGSGEQESDVAQSMPMNASGAGESIAKPSSFSSSPITVPLSVKEGMYVSRGQTVFNVVDPRKVVVKLQIKGQDIAKIKVNSDVVLEVDETPKNNMRGKINFIEPFLQPGNTTLLARVNIDNSTQKHKVGTLVNAIVQGELIEGMWVPASAVVDLGNSKIVWVKKDEGFIVRKIETGMITKNWVEVIDGVSKRDEIAIEGHYLADSEGFIKTTNNDQ